jgi:Flp pilus assembly pilin Flp
MIASRLDSEAGQTMTEYAVVLGVISIATVGALTSLAGGAAALFEAVLSAVSAIP